MKVLADFHHHALAESLAVLFEDRYGGELFFPIGMDWFDRGIWQFEKQFHGDRVARQYLEGIWHDAVDIGNGVWRRHDPRHPGRIHHGITHDAARDTRWDVVISTLPPNDPGFYHMARMASGECRFGIQVGNNHQVSSWDKADFILSSSTLPEFGLVRPDTWGRIQTGPGGKPTVVYHQEFSLESFRHEWPPLTHGIASFVNCFPEGPSYPDFLEFARSHRQFDFRVNGAMGRPSWWKEERPYEDEFTGEDISEVPRVAQAMRDARVIWHTKHWSDGFGHVIHNAFAVGRPVIGYQRYYHDKLAGPLWVQGVTSFDIEGMSPGDLAGLLERLTTDDEWHRSLSLNAAMRFRDLVSFDQEADVIRELVGA